MKERTWVQKKITKIGQDRNEMGWTLNVTGYEKSITGSHKKSEKRITKLSLPV
jgi:hypothetical protein